MLTRATAYAKLKNRRNPEDWFVKEAYANLQEDEPVKYLVGSMEPVLPRYTEITKEQGERVKNQLVTGLSSHGLTASYAYQGSTTKNTHIKGYSDIDLLVLDGRFESYESATRVAPGTHYVRDVVADLVQLRTISIQHLCSAFPKAEVNHSGARSFKISGGSLSRTVDVVPGNWYNTEAYLTSFANHRRGVHILNAHVPTREEDLPFYHGHLLDQKESATANVKKLIRLLKSLKYDSDDKVTMSSFDIESLVYRMPDSELHKAPDQHVPLAYACYLWLRKVETENTLRIGLEVPDGKRKIFSNGKATIEQLSALREELGRLLIEIEQGFQRSFRKLAEARTIW